MSPPRSKKRGRALKSSEPSDLGRDGTDLPPRLRALHEQVEALVRKARKEPAFSVLEACSRERVAGRLVEFVAARRDLDAAEPSAYREAQRGFFQAATDLSDALLRELDPS